MFEADALRHLQVLIVEDNRHMRTLLCAMLGSIGITNVTQAPDGEAGLRLLRDTPCDIVFTDMAMQPLDGMAFTRTLRNSPASPNNFVPIVMITGHTEKYRVEEARDAGVTELLAKPITTQHLYDRIMQIVEQPRPFVRTSGFFGPDRRRREDDHIGTPRREEDKPNTYL